MKITVITGSPHRHGASALLADEFIRGAAERGHSIFRFDAAFEQVHPCTGCGVCGIGRGTAPCVQNDAMDKLNPRIIEAEVVVFVTPLYYFGFSSQIKTVIDRFCTNNHKLTGNKKCILMATSYDCNDWTMTSLFIHYQALAYYLKWESIGKILAAGCGTRESIENSDFPDMAYRLGKSL